jgi:hypothetical protein
MPGPQYATYVRRGAAHARCQPDVPFTIGETLTLGNPETGEQLGVFTVAQIGRQIMYRTKQTEPPVCVPLTGQTIRVDLQACRRLFHRDGI